MQCMWQNIIAGAGQVPKRWHAAARLSFHTVATQQAFAINVQTLLRSFVMLPDVQRMQMQLLAYCCFATNA